MGIRNPGIFWVGRNDNNKMGNFKWCLPQSVHVFQIKCGKAGWLHGELREQGAFSSRLWFHPEGENSKQGRSQWCWSLRSPVLPRDQIHPVLLQVEESRIWSQWELSRNLWDVTWKQQLRRLDDEWEMAFLVGWGISQNPRIPGLCWKGP